ncbi:flagellar protein FlaG [Clostridium beijerinckii]|uniref:flagellar protein FlaG n=1 Tax=Clostridium beijerinckii TaxID=1520 RepID=UPI001360B7EE|nr:flagellar protein FlaG [Clostridium beijerinckii]MZK49894.1 flagellar biosynthesis protein FlaG [Clostridium beijerinckii]MZK57853.1 flagellar biosynthesis protein FlaG [Clostridium beijerinckii]MZK68064.1 flagellar biosynthesis protein FlaG [Clostridium beijerinckii]MZK73562.1 flagellar biosynthesis protein FlaG [Clostridium beijerinckii]MZK83144.1 flagellar biosynthesis protein FlaG [Clostridium beijerinckii]
MDVNNIGQNLSNSNLQSNQTSNYTNTSTDAPVQQIQNTQQVENQQQKLNDNSKVDRYTKKDLDYALKKINNFLKDENTRAEYDYYKDLKTTTIKIIDVDTKEVLLEVPPKKILDMVASMMRQVGLLDKKA